MDGVQNISWFLSFYISFLNFPHIFRLRCIKAFWFSPFLILWMILEYLIIFLNYFLWKHFSFLLILWMIFKISHHIFQLLFYLRFFWSSLTLCNGWCTFFLNFIHFFRLSFIKIFLYSLTSFCQWYLNYLIIFFHYFLLKLPCLLQPHLVDGVKISLYFCLFTFSFLISITFY